MSDIAILTPLQLAMIAVVGGLSCRPFAKETVYEYLAAAGVNVSIAWGVREMVRQLLKLLPAAGPATSGVVAGAATLALGKAAQAYFFEGEIKKPDPVLRTVFPEWFGKGPSTDSS